MGDLAKQLKRRILTIDFERLSGLAPIFDQRTRGFIPAHTWRRLPSTLCFTARWFGQSRFIFRAAWDDHEQMVRAAWDLYDQADIVVTYNGIKADNPWIQGDWAKYEIYQPRPWKNVDLYVVGKKFGYPSRSLDHLCQQLGIEGKNGHYDPDVAELAAAGNKTAQRNLRSYNRGDIEATERLYKRLLPWIHTHPHVNVKSAELTCNRCGSEELTRQPTDYLATQLEYAQYRCDSCGGLVRAAYTRRAATTRGIQ